MLPYWLLFTAFAAGTLQFRSGEARAGAGGPLFLLATVAMILIVGFRYQVGGDWDNYLEIFEYTGFLDLAGALAVGDPGYSLINWSMFQLGLGIWGVNLACAAIFVWGLVKFARCQPNPWLAILLATPYLIIVVGMGYTRQAVAIGLIMAGLSTIQGRAILWFSFYIALAATFHRTAILVLPLVALGVVRKHFFGAGSFLFLFVLFYYLFLDHAADRLVASYIEAQYDSEGAVIRVAMNVLPAVVFLIASKRFELNDVQRQIWRNFSLAALVCVPLLFLMSGTTVVDRLALYLIPLQVFVLSRIPRAFSAGERPNPEALFMLVVYSAFVQFVWLNYASHAEWWLPYQFYPLEEVL